MGEDVLYSGTVSVAMEAVTLGIPGIAFSFAGRDPDLIASYHETLVRLIRRITSMTDFPRKISREGRNRPTEDALRSR